MGYRNYFYLVDKSLVETVKDMSMSSLLSLLQTEVLKLKMITCGYSIQSF